MEALRVALCEDVPEDRKTLLTLLQGIPIRTECVIFSSGEALLEIYRPFLFDLLLLDIYMGSLTGIETAAKIRETDEEVPIAFVTTSQDFTRESYRLSALSYLEKPVSQKKLTEILELARMKKKTGPPLSCTAAVRRKRFPFRRFFFLNNGRAGFWCICAAAKNALFTKSSPPLSRSWRENPFLSPTKATASIFRLYAASIRSCDASRWQTEATFPSAGKACPGQKGPTRTFFSPGRETGCSRRPYQPVSRANSCAHSTASCTSADRFRSRTPTTIFSQ